MEAISLELRFFLASILWGIILLLVYDGIRVTRRIVKHNKAAEWCEDIIFWVVSACFIFKLMYQMNNGSIRIFSIIGVTLGMIVYHYSVSYYLVKFLSEFIHKIIHLIRKIIGFIMRPIVFLLRRAKWLIQFFAKLFRRPLRFFRKSLKNIWKTVKIGVVKK